MKWENFSESGKAWKEAVMAFLKVLAQNCPAWTEEKHENCLLSYFVQAKVQT
jgi:hypothetical protein